MNLPTVNDAPDPRDPRASSLLVARERAGAGEIALLGLPFDSSIPSRPGAKLGPGAFRDALATLSTFDGERDLAGTTIADLGDLDLPPTSVRRAHEIVESASQEVFAAGAIPFFIGGDNGLTGALLRGLAAARPEAKFALVVIDAHYDVREYEDEETLSSGTPYRRALETSAFDGAHTAIVGTRPFANSAYYHRWAVDQGITILPVEEFDRKPAHEIAAHVLSKVSEGTDGVFLSIDIDAVGSGEAPGSSAAHPAGLTAREAVAFVRTIARGGRLIGADLSELSPPWDFQDVTAKLAARLFLEIVATR